MSWYCIARFATGQKSSKSSKLIFQPNVFGRFFFFKLKQQKALKRGGGPRRSAIFHISGRVEKKEERRKLPFFPRISNNFITHTYFFLFLSWASIRVLFIFVYYLNGFSIILYEVVATSTHNCILFFYFCTGSFSLFPFLSAVFFVIRFFFLPRAPFPSKRDLSKNNFRSSNVADRGLLVERFPGRRSSLLLLRGRHCFRVGTLPSGSQIGDKLLSFAKGGSRESRDFHMMLLKDVKKANLVKFFILSLINLSS